jgi:sugar phosphate isomerase/epimerase
MKLSISNIAWTEEQDEAVYTCMKQYGFNSLEIAPTRIFPDSPYDRLQQAQECAQDLKKQYGLEISSMQSIWYGRQENIFGSKEERQALLDYTKKAIDFAEAIGCGNLVFGCPKNRNLPEGANPEIAIDFFRELGNYAFAHHTVIGMEANPPIYQTNYINTTEAALELIEQVDSKGFRLNLDLGTMIYNQESVSLLKDQVKRINHVHISEPGLKMIEERQLHSELKNILMSENYQGYLSIEMGRREQLQELEDVMKYVREIF